jgi:hypothetical protein
MGVRGGCAVVVRPILELGRAYRSRLARVRLSKIDDYLVDNLSCHRLSELRRAVNDKSVLRRIGF